MNCVYNVQVTLTNLQRQLYNHNCSLLIIDSDLIDDSDNGELLKSYR